MTTSRLLLLLLTASAPALGGSGPWVLGEGARNVYVGVEAQRLTKLAIIADGERSVIDVDEGLQTFGAKLIGTLGLSKRIDVEFDIPYYRVHANAPGAVCESLAVPEGRGSCETTSSIGIITARAKAMILDEIVGRPVTFSAGIEARFGDFTAQTRDRITNLGEGTFDAGGFASVGRTVTLGSGYWSTAAEVGGRYRFPKSRSYASADGSQTVAAPGPEFWTTIESLFFLDPRLGIGPVGTLFTRPFGLDFGDLDLTSLDRLSALRATNIRAGGQIILRSRDNLSVSINVQRVLWAQNNPTDVWVAGLGVGLYLPQQQREDN